MGFRRTTLPLLYILFRHIPRKIPLDRSILTTCRPVSAGIICLSADTVALLFVFVGVQRFAHAGEMKAKMEEMKGEANAKVENAKGEAKALSEEAQGNRVKGAMERTE